MAADFGLAVRYKAPGEADFTIQPVDGATEQDELVRHLRDDRGMDATPVALAYRPVLEAQMTHAEREDFLFSLEMVDAMEIADFVREFHPEVFDAAAARVRRVRKNVDRARDLAAARRTAAQQGDDNT